MKIHRFQNPFEHWRSGLAAELLAFALFMLVVAGAVVLLARML